MNSPISSTLANAVSGSFDVAVVGAGIVGLAHALAAARRGKRVVVIDRDAHANGASIRNFGFITVTGQQARRMLAARHALARRLGGGRAEAPASPSCMQGSASSPAGPEASAVLEAFMATEMGADCRLLDPARPAADRAERVARRCGQAALWSPHEMPRRKPRRHPASRAPGSRTPRRHLPACRPLVQSVEPPRIETTRGSIAAEAVIVCPGDDFLHAVPRAHRALRPDALQAAHDARRSGARDAGA